MQTSVYILAYWLRGGRMAQRYVFLSQNLLTLCGHFFEGLDVSELLRKLLISWFCCCQQQVSLGIEAKPLPWKFNDLITEPWLFLDKSVEFLEIVPWTKRQETAYVTST